ncbi:MAG: tetratricopeptide repeat protein [Proteobacteria bacterium]|nr:tetratricopeptide repeat protein [Pseudomonadota bacterium]
MLILVRIVLLVMALALSAGAKAEKGQYRSKVLLSPVGEIDKGAGLSIKELEQQIDGIEQAYSKSSAGRHLARHYVAQGEYDKALEYYQTALAAQGLSDIANREMLREMAQVQLLKEDYKGAVQTLEQVLRSDLVPTIADYLLLAQAHHRLGNYVTVVAVLDQLEEKSLNLDAQQTHQALALYYSAGAYAQCETLLVRLLQLEPDNPENWHLLVSVYLQQNKKDKALDRLALAREKSVSFTEREILLLADLHAVNENPYGAAEVLSAALLAQEAEASGDNYRKLFEFWYQAREKTKAQQALIRAAQLSGDTQLYLYLAQLQMDQQNWQSMHKTMLAACKDQLQDKFVSRANLLLGVSQLKLDDTVGARRSFINATLIGGAGEQAGQWLNFMNAAPASKDELRRIVGVCYGTRDKRGSVASISNIAAEAATIEQPSSAVISIQTKTVPQMRLYYTESELPVQEVLKKLNSVAMRMNMSLVKARGTVDGQLQLIYTRHHSGEGDGRLQVALPVRGLPTTRGQYKSRTAQAFKCAYLGYRGEAAGLGAVWAGFVQSLEDQGYRFTGETRLVFSTGTGDGLDVEVQLGID